MAADDDFEEELLRVAGRSKSATKKRSRQAAESDDEEPAGGSNKGRSSAAKKANVALSDDSDGEDAEYSDEDERAKLDNMNELEREMYLFERAEQREREKQRMAVVDQARKADQVRRNRQLVLVLEAHIMQRQCRFVAQSLWAISCRCGQATLRLMQRLRNASRGSDELL